MDNWDEIRTAFHVARAGTVSKAAEDLRVHHATVIRHIDALEERLGVKLFQRHARGYTPTEAGQDLLSVARGADNQFSQLESRLRGGGREISGELVITSLAVYSHLLVPLLKSFQAQYPDLIVRYLSGERLFRLEYGEAHVAVRAGAAPSQPDNVVQPLYQDQVGLYASATYVERFGKPSGLDDLARHRFVGLDDPISRAPFAVWMNSNIPREQVVFRSDDIRDLREAIVSGAGIGFLSRSWAAQQSGLIELAPPGEPWNVPVWLVTHIDLHRTAKVQTFLSYIKKEALSWPSPPQTGQRG